MITIRRRLLLLLLPALVVLMLLGGLVDYWIASTTTGRAYDRALATTALALAAYIRVEDGRLRYSPPSSATLPTSGRAVLQGELFDGSTLYAIRSPTHELIAGTPLPDAGMLGAQTAGTAKFRNVAFQGQSWRVASLFAPTAVGAVEITVAEAPGRREHTQSVMLLGKLLVDFAELDFTLLLIWIAVSYGLRPLRRLTEQVEGSPTGQLQQFNEALVPGELRPLIIAFNRVLEMLRSAAAAQHRFVGDAAHQMRTPVAGLLAQLELLLREPRVPPTRPQLDALHQGIQQLARAANQLLALARAEPMSSQQEPFQAVALGPLVERLVERQLERADRAKIDLGADAGAASVSGNPWLLEDLLENLVDNALKYTAAGGHVTVRSGIEASVPYLEVEDDGPGIPEAERQRVRERFYRRPGSPGIGCGLGLAIVDEIARLHRAGLQIGPGAGGRGTRMQVRFRPTA
jgi:two-component system sensor histidine kinase TctE